jgi:hypothetical protein
VSGLRRGGVNLRKPVPRRQYRVGNYYLAAGDYCGNLFGVSAADGLFDIMPLTIEDQTITIDEMRVAVGSTAGSAGSVGRFGVYRDNGNAFGGQLFRDIGVTDGTVALTTANTQVARSLSPALVLPPGLWWIGFATQGAPATNPNMKAIDQMFHPLIGSNDTAQLNQPTALDRNCWTTNVTPIPGALPTDYPSDAVVLAAAYAILLHVSAVS